ncbi:UDP-N-acetylglucosamine 2-epimerase, partial [Candidatus Fermentibacteria bacterium]|nr:UDP-N-acetylglucosamine 2-epimerase [Candidatus Fermentibacteria bacterium]
AHRIHLVGNVMIDTLTRLLPQAAEHWSAAGTQEQRLQAGDGGGKGDLGRVLTTRPYCLVTLHRPSNVDDPPMLGAIIDALGDISRHIPVIFPVHPRTMAILSRIGDSRFVSGGAHFVSGAIAAALAPTSDSVPQLRLLPPLGYLDFLALQMHATVVITDSGGMQEETTYLGVPCLTVRANTERPITVSMGTNTLIGRDMIRLRAEVSHILGGHGKRGEIPPLWDGRAAERIASIIVE